MFFSGIKRNGLIKQRKILKKNCNKLQENPLLPSWHHTHHLYILKISTIIIIVSNDMIHHIEKKKIQLNKETFRLIHATKEYKEN